ncbi:MAG: hypothetical protein EOP09_17555 [Proteobacteria bacterium]|nr:MAG: hypothetical protein EOP09_17555 [Pseudomonadota bacterium]
MKIPHPTRLRAVVCGAAVAAALSVLSGCASDGKVGTILDRIILFCYQYDPQLRQYSMSIFRVVRFAAAGMILFLAIYLGLFWFRQRATVKHSSTGGG